MSKPSGTGDKRTSTRDALHNARLSIPNATVEGIAYYEDRKLSRKDFTLFSTCKYIEDKHHIIFKGASGNGKTYLACALGEAA